ncbi:MAG: hypothetical protein WC781_04540 [Candidatus Pacearchaeota archaeon]
MANKKSYKPMPEEEILNTLHIKHKISYFEKEEIYANVIRGKELHYQAYFQLGDKKVYGPIYTGILGRYNALNALEAWLYDEKPFPRDLSSD